MAALVLSGARIEDIPPVMKSPARLMFDQRQMDRWGIRRTDLPENSVVINAPPPFYAVNKGLVWGVGFNEAQGIEQDICGRARYRKNRQ